jgi:hypothetical protein
MIPGMAVAMGGQDWIVPPLTLGQLRRLMPKVRKLTEIGASMGETQVAVLVDIVTAALQRNYPEMTPERVENLLDLGNAGSVLNASSPARALSRADPPWGKQLPPGSARGQSNRNSGCRRTTLPG